MSNEREVPKGRLSRLARLASMGVRTGARHVTGQQVDGAKAMADTLGALRGLAAKLGQMASYVDGVLPDAHSDTYADALSALRSQTPRSSAAEIRRTIEQELDAPVEDLFATWEDEPFASASIGQVHRATLHDGRKVAVKVQHPGIVAAIEADLSNASVLERFLGPMGLHKFDSKAIFATIKARFLEELDYLNEARRTEQFAALFADDPDLRIPRVIASRSGRHVITTEFIEGLPLDSVMEKDEAERRRVAEILWRFVYRSILVGGVFNADPHPGNYVLQADGRIAVLDFGCVQEVAAKRLEMSKLLHSAAVEGDLETINRYGGEMVDAKPGPLGDRAKAYMVQCFVPILESPYRITRPWTAQLFAEMKSMALQAATAPKDQFFSMPPEVVFMNRLQFGFYSILARLDVEVDYRAVERAFHREFGQAA